MKSLPLEDVLTTVAHSPNVVSRRPIYEKYDKNVQGNTFVERGQAAVSVIVPFNDFSELPVEKKTIGVAVGTGGNPNVALVAAGMAAEMGIAEAALKIACVGGTWLGATDCLNFGNPEKPDSMGDFVAGVEGLKTACSTLNIPIVSGNVSLYNESEGQPVPPSALVSVFGRIDDIQSIKPSHWAGTDLYIYQVGQQSSALGGSEFNRLFDLGSTQLPALDYAQVQANADKLRSLVTEDGVKAIIPLGAGGVWGTLLGAALESGTGFVLNLSPKTVVSDLLAETLGALVITTTEQPELTLLGRTQADGQASFNVGAATHSFDLEGLAPAWHDQLRAIF